MAFSNSASLPDALHVGKTQGLIIEGFAVRAVLTWGETAKEIHTVPFEGNHRVVARATT
jgi:hypothetical protein